MELEGYDKVDFMTALRTWDGTNKEVICVYRQHAHTFPTNCDWRADFVVNGGMILDGEWYVKNNK